VILLKTETAIFGLLRRFSTGQRLHFSTCLSLPSARGWTNGVPTLNQLFVWLTVSSVQ